MKHRQAERVVDATMELERASALPERLAYRPAELAVMVGLSVKAIYRAIERGELQAARIANGSRLLIPAEAAERWLRASVPELQPAPDRRRVEPAGHRRPLAAALLQLEAAEDEE